MSTIPKWTAENRPKAYQDLVTIGSDMFLVKLDDGTFVEASSEAAKKATTPSSNLYLNKGYAITAGSGEEKVRNRTEYMRMQEGLRLVTNPFTISISAIYRIAKVFSFYHFWPCNEIETHVVDGAKKEYQLLNRATNLAQDIALIVLSLPLLVVYEIIALVGLIFPDLTSSAELWLEETVLSSYFSEQVNELKLYDNKEINAFLTTLEQRVKKEKTEEKKETEKTKEGKQSVDKKDLSKKDLAVQGLESILPSGSSSSPSSSASSSSAFSTTSSSSSSSSTSDSTSSSSSSSSTSDSTSSSSSSSSTSDSTSSDSSSSSTSDSTSSGSSSSSMSNSTSSGSFSSLPSDSTSSGSSSSSMSDSTSSGSSSSSSNKSSNSSKLNDPKIPLKGSPSIPTTKKLPFGITQKRWNSFTEEQKITFKKKPTSISNTGWRKLSHKDRINYLAKQKPGS